MLRAAVVVLVFVSACAARQSPIGEQRGPQLQCAAPKNTHVKVVMRTQQNETGHWVSRVAVKTPMQSSTGTESDHWKVDVEQNADTCEDDDTSVLETVFYLSAPPSYRGVSRPNTSPNSGRSTHDAQWACPICTPCPSCQPTPAPSPPTRVAAPPGYQRFAGIGYYKFHTDAQTWTAAREICEQEGGHLLVLNSDKEADAMITLMNSFTTAPGVSSNSYIYVGAQRIGTTYTTVLDDQLTETGYVRWSPGEPTGGNEFCLTLVRPTALFNDIPCDWKLAYICEHLRRA